jgi:hypothetical protein
VPEAAECRAQALLLPPAALLDSLRSVSQFYLKAAFIVLEI